MEKEDVLSTRASSVPSLNNFTIPRKKKGDGKKALLEPCSKKSIDYSLLQKTLRDSRLDTAKELSLTWQCDDIKLVHNKDLLKEFSDKRSEMRSKERNTRELEDMFCFLFTSYHKAAQIYEHGLRVDSLDQQSLGNPTYGVYLHRHADVALKNARGSAHAGGILVIFKVLFGRTKKVSPRFGRSSSFVDPTVNYDCHVSKDTVTPRDSFTQQVIGSSVFLFDYNDEQELRTRPRQCLPFAAVSIKHAQNPSPSTPLRMSIPAPSLKLTPLDPALILDTCTVAERRGKGQNATVKFKYFGMPEAADMPRFTEFRDGSSQMPPNNLWAPNIESQPSQQLDLVHPHSSLSGENTRDHIDPFNPVKTGQTIPYNQRQQTERVSSVMYSSSLIKDPRIQRRSLDDMETSLSVNVERECDKMTSGCETVGKVRLEVDTSRLLKEKHSVVSKIKGKADKQCKLLEDPSLSADGKAAYANETLPSGKMLKMKFRKYAAYLPLSKEERKEKVCSLKNLSSAEKNILLERINFYDHFYQRQKVTVVPNENVCTVKSCKTGKDDIFPITKSSQKSSSATPIGNNYLQRQQKGQIIDPCDSSKTVRTSKMPPRFLIKDLLIHKHGPVQDLSLPLGLNLKHLGLDNSKDKHYSASPKTESAIQANANHPENETKTKEEATGENVDTVCRDAKEVMAPSSGIFEKIAPTEPNRAMHMDKQTTDQMNSHDRTKLCVQSGRKTVTSEQTVTIPISSSNWGDLNCHTNTDDQIKTVNQTPDLGIDSQDTMIRSQSASAAVKLPNDDTERRVAVTKDQPKPMVWSDETIRNGVTTRLDEGHLEASGEDASLEKSKVQSREDPDCGAVCHHGSPADMIGACENVYSEDVYETEKSECISRSTLKSPHRDIDMEHICILQQLDSQTKTHGSDVLDVSCTRQSEKLPFTDTVYLALCSRIHSQLRRSSFKNVPTLCKNYLKPKHSHVAMEMIKRMLPSSNSTDNCDDEDGCFPITIEGIDCEHCALGELPSLSKRFSFPGSTEVLPNKQTNEALANNSCDSGKITITGGRNSPTNSCKREGANPETSYNVKLLRWLADKYNKKEKASLIRKKIKYVNQMKDISNSGKPFVDHPQTVASNESSKQTCDETSPIEVHQNTSINQPVTDGKRKLKTNTCFPSNVRSKINRRLRTKSKVEARRLSTLNSASSINAAMLKSQRSVIMLRDFRRSKSWWNYNYKCPTNRVQGLSKRSNLSAGNSDGQEEIVSECNSSPSQPENKQQLTLNDQLTTTNPSTGRSETTMGNTRPQLSDTDVKAISTVKIISEKLSESVSGSEKNDSDEQTTNINDLSLYRTFNNNIIPNTEASQITPATSDDKLLQRCFSITSGPYHESVQTVCLNKPEEKKNGVDVESEISTPITPRDRLLQNDSDITTSECQENGPTIHQNKMAENEERKDIKSERSIPMDTELIESTPVAPGVDSFQSDCAMTSSQCQENVHPVNLNSEVEGNIGENAQPERSMQIEPIESPLFNPGEPLLQIHCATDSKACQVIECPENLNKMEVNRDGKENKVEDVKQDVSIQVDTEPCESIEETSGPNRKTRDKEVVSHPEVTVYPLDAAIEILCGSEASSVNSECSESSDPSHLPMTGDKTNASDKEVKLITRLREFLTQFESTVQKEEEIQSIGQALETDDENVLRISEASKEEDNRQPQPCQSVKFLVLDRVELPYLKENKKRNSNQKNTERLHYQFGITQEGQNNGKYGTNILNVEKFPDMESEESAITDKEKTKVLMADNVHCISPDSTSMLEASEFFTKPATAQVTKDVNNSEISTSVPDTVWKSLKERLESYPSTEQLGNSYSLHPCANNINANNINIMMPQSKLVPPDVIKPNIHAAPPKSYTVIDISRILRQGDEADSVFQLSSLRNTCKIMLQHFISNFEKNQDVQANRIAVTRDLILERYLDHPPWPTELKYKAIDSFLELQMMLESWQFVDNKMRYLSGQSTFRSLLWYDSTLYGELFRGRVGFQHQSSLYPTFQTSLALEGPTALQRHHSAVSLLCQRLRAAPETSYYMYLKSKREKLEIEAALRNPPDMGSFYLSVPLSCMLNVGNSMKSLQRIQNLVTIFTETPADQLQEKFDVGKAEHLALMCRFLQEKILYLKTTKNTEFSQISWFGMEHLFYDASKVLVWRDASCTHPAPHKVLSKYSAENAQIVYGKTESDVALLHQRLSAKYPRILVKASLSGQQSKVPDTTCKAKGRGKPKKTRSCAKNKVAEQVIDLTGGTSPERPDDGFNKGRPRVRHLARPPNPPTPLYQSVSQPQTNLFKNQVINHIDQSHEDQQQSHVIPQPHLSQAIQPFPEIRACLPTEKVAMEKAQTHLQPGSKSAIPLHWPCPWRLHDNRLRDGTVLSMLPTWPHAVSNKGCVPIFSQEETPPSIWSSSNPSFLQPPPPSPTPLPVNSVEQPCRSHPLPSTTNHGLPLLASPPINYPYFLLNGQTYSTNKPSASKETLCNQTRFHPYSYPT